MNFLSCKMKDNFEGTPPSFQIEDVIAAKPLTPHPSLLSIKGFTLLEVLVALAVTAIAMGALWKGLSQGIMVSQGLPERTMARWVAQNRLVLRQAMDEWPDARSYTGSTSMGGQDWLWEEQITTTEEVRIRRVVVTVGTEDTPLLFTLEGYLQRPVEPEPTASVNRDGHTGSVL
ncbi:MAG: type II secretion system minor pseudopilin GspI [Gammaproteobacteria bacterium]